MGTTAVSPAALGRAPLDGHTWLSGLTALVVYFGGGLSVLGSVVLPSGGDAGNRRSLALQTLGGSSPAAKINQLPDASDVTSTRHPPVVPAPSTAST